MTLAENIRKPFARSSIRAEPIDVNESIRRVIEGIDKPPDVQILFRDDPGVPPVQATMQLDEVFDHLVKNALDVLASYESEQDKRIEIVVQWPEQESVTVCVSDSGPGFPEDREPFLLGSSTKPKGLGLSLWWSRLYLQRIGGDIELVDREKPGCTFRVRIPADVG
ncbi:MAG: sensor histidine kinase [Anaerolineae bacterium]|nr:sensor histidine kinase [Anaerolineae bacterium]